MTSYTAAAEPGVARSVEGIAGALGAVNPWEPLRVTRSAASGEKRADSPSLAVVVPVASGFLRGRPLFRLTGCSPGVSVCWGNVVLAVFVVIVLDSVVVGNVRWGDDCDV